MSYPDTVELSMHVLADAVFRIRVFASERHREKAKEFIGFILREWDERHSRLIADIIEMVFSSEDRLEP